MVPDSQSSSRKGDVSPAAEPVMVRRNDGNASGSLKWGVSPLSPVAEPVMVRRNDGSGSGGLERGVSLLSPVARAVVREASSGPTEDPGGSPLLQRDTCE